LGDRTDRIQLVLPHAAQIFLPESSFVQKFPEDVRELRVSVVVLAIDLPTTLGQVMFQLPQIFGVFAWLALVLAAVGLHSVVSYTVAQRTTEFGIRMALGAQRADVLRMVFRAASVSLGAGILAGIALSFALNQIIAKWAQANPRDPGILLAGTILLGFVSGLACAIPARRASKVDPMIALRSE
jgi:ABC-type antimicrobial peptide transport system permease subunit